mmetsp:Transcript_119773/g.194858  ORF Transcript_119773/g.194858 Transcript_119773/m.194858 type:complete len:566 (-) Transcript_119773:210-1907(-)
MIHIMWFSALVMWVAPNIVSGSTFLKQKADGATSHISAQEVQVSLLSEIEGSLGTGTAAKKLNALEAQLRPMYNALPKNADGGLSHSVVRYALHRLFVQRHGWMVKGLDPDGGSFNASSPADILKDQVPTYIQGLFEKRLHGKGMGLHELAVFGATIEHLIHNEAVGRVGDALNVHQILATSTMSEQEADEVLDTYMMAYILGENLKNMTKESSKDAVAEMPELYHDWKDTQVFMREKRAEVTAATQAHEINFATLAKVAEAAGEHFGTFQDKDCRELKDKLVAMEDRGSGRVRLADFYKPAMKGAWQFQESVQYLRELGALDESDANDKRVIIPNYLQSPTNCIASSSFYSVCCMDECESLMGHLEKEIAGPEAPADHLASLVSKLPSSSVTAPRTLSPSLLKRLDDIAASHDGTVPIHGRLFTQWMHHAFPRECQYPHVSGTTNPQTSEEWEAEGKTSTATRWEMSQYISKAAQAEAFKAEAAKTEAPASEVEDVQVPWLHEEELLQERTAPAASSSTGSTLRNVMLFSALGSVLIGLVRTGQSTSPQKKKLGYEGTSDKLYV